MLTAAITVEGNIAADPELRYTTAGLAICEFRVIVNDRTKKNGEWVDTEPMAFRVLTWRQLAENVAESLTKGDRVIVHGRPFIDRWVIENGDQAGEIRTMPKLNAEAVGLSLQWNAAKVVKSNRTANAERADEWATTPATTDEPPF